MSNDFTSSDFTINYEEFQQRQKFDDAEILAFAHGNMVTDAPKGFDSRLPLPPMLMVDRITDISGTGKRGLLVAERNVRLDDWFYQCHFANDPVQPGCLGVDAIWQLLGFYGVWRGGLGTGRALGCGEIEFAGQIRPHNKLVRYEIEVRRFSQLAQSGATFIVGDATVSVDDEIIYRMKNMRVGLFQDIAYSDYPLPSARSRGGLMAV